ncbi:MAG: hypothetical protein AAGM22_14965 [Acidobacteriota bacterium]
MEKLDPAHDVVASAFDLANASEPGSHFAAGLFAFSQPNPTISKWLDG